jgi:hypothetical protein
MKWGRHVLRVELVGRIIPPSRSDTRGRRATEVKEGLGPRAVARPVLDRQSN